MREDRAVLPRLTSRRGPTPHASLRLPLARALARPRFAGGERTHRLLAEAAIVALVGGAFAIILADRSDEISAAATWVAACAAIVQTAALRRRHAHPQQTAAVSLLAALVLQLACPYAIMPFGAYVAVGSLAWRTPPRRSAWTLVALIALGLGTLATPDVVAPSQSLFVACVGAAVWVYGELRRNRVVHQQADARRAVGLEQARIARELHDVVSHSVSVIVVQAAAANEVFDDRPERARESLQAIEATAREALGELRRLLGAIRTDEEAETVQPSPAPYTPQPSLSRIEDLASRVRATGLVVTVRREGPPLPVPPGVDLSAYRIVQEALTNTLRHAGATRAEIALRYAPGQLELDVCDDGCGERGGSARDGAGRGLGTTGMRERAALLGGTLHAGPAPHGGYRVHALLPLDPIG
jgi:signal transduction histidine kinase